MKTLTIPQHEPQLSLFPVVEERSMAHQEFYQYFFLVSPPDPIKNKVQGLKNSLSQNIGLSARNLNSIAHISLHNILRLTPLEHNREKGFYHTLSQNRPFSVRFKGFDFFSHGTSHKTIYAKIEDVAPLALINIQLSILFNEPFTSFTPHMTIARKIGNHLFERGYTQVQQQPFEERFFCNKIIVLERKFSYGMFGKYRVFEEIELTKN